ncbi:hypothetical protein [Acinetobacter gerneri]|uniref:Uncharacterized protein n=1 Tax=Acinetobacter gerneri DSM 14967 = CIP 107464 = MTCC 9824 TaxID=1120926 RepID=N8Y7X6_9GAMM|nr:hypothetical protein [Acinetobacter gerneri]ENV32736.1 hypothetical protein F960_02911 [Acinetobacter gerneri DSM 14967 = CIP 107464 = MTCC 9824]EPR83910.1 hypothetical protein L289_1834 [Acinetobacter gerneri DSM 14967 = CIP 107464 = MTCC 9824]
MNLKAFSLFFLGLTCASFSSAAETELDQYLIKKQIIDSSYKIKNPAALKDVLFYLSDEDSRTLPLQIDQNTIIEKLRLYPDHIEIQGIITTPDFTQFENSIGENEVKKLLHRNVLENCKQIFEHEFQRKNPYYVAMNLSSEQHHYQIKLNSKECNFN